ncbi:MAG: thiamine phosphate synthase [Thiogranum sp.]|nr:thiamine phosphate synthase [Thiogranum sp.]
MSRSKLHGLYAVTDAALQPPQQLTERVKLAIAGGARLIQYRDKSADAQLRLQQASELAQLCRMHGVLLIINDDVQLTEASGADGVHLGRDDADAAAARRQLGAQAVIGVSCYNEWSLAVQAVQAGADYVAFGRFFPSRTKPLAVQSRLDLISEARQQLSVPVAAIGGITPCNGRILLDAGADMLAVVQGVFGADDIAFAAAAYAALFEANTAQRASQPSS